MGIRTLLRSSSVLWASPFCAGLTLFYYFAVAWENLFRQDLGYAPTLVSVPLETAYAFAYGVAAALGAWESGRLARGAVWELAPARSRYRVAAQALAPVIGLAWLMLILPVSIALVQGGALPTPVSLGPLVLGLLLCAAHAVIGFAVGRYVPRVVAAPMLAIGVWLVVATSVATSDAWRRHTMGQYVTGLMFGETATLSSLVAQALPTAGVALAVALLWAPIRWMAMRVLLGAVVAVACVSTAHTMVRDWEHDPPLAIGQVPMRCAGTAPRVCMPEATVHDIRAVETEVGSAVAAVVELGIAEPPATVTDSLPEGRSSLPSTPDTWRLGLTTGERQDTVRYRVVDEAVDFPCSRPDPLVSRIILRWAAERTGVADTFEEFLARDIFYDAAQRAYIHDEVAAVLARSPDAQLRWYWETLAESCGESP